MPARAERRRAVREVVKHAKANEVDELSQAYKTIEVLKDYCRDAKYRVEHFAFSLQMISKLIILGDLNKVQATIRVVQSEGLKEAREAVGKREQALDIAIKALQSPTVNSPRDALAQIKMLVPDLFGAEASPVPEASA